MKWISILLTAVPISPGSPFLPLLPRLPGGPGGPEITEGEIVIMIMFILMFNPRPFRCEQAKDVGVGSDRGTIKNQQEMDNSSQPTRKWSQ